MVNMKYAPILKWKAAEIGALHDLTKEQKKIVAPVFEFVRPLKISDKEIRDGVKSPEDKLLRVLSESIPEDILKKWGDGRPFFADFTLIFPEDLRKKFAEEFCKNSEKRHLEFISVVNLSADSSDYQKHIVKLVNSYASSKLCIRLNSAEIQDVDMANSLLRQFLSTSNLVRPNVFLLVDLKEKTSDDMYNMAFNNIQKIEGVAEYANVILAGGAFPKDMSQYKKDEEDNHQKREDWNGWVSRAKNSIARTPVFADYTIRHPVYDEIVIKYQSTATIKYTTKDRWNIYKGAKGKFDNYLAYASILRVSPDFYGAEFSAGDLFIDKKGEYFPTYMEEVNNSIDGKVGGTGSTEQWLRAGINHHIAVVVDQISNLGD